MSMLLDMQAIRMVYDSRGPQKGGLTPAVDGVDLQVPAKSIVGLVGESGSGKTTLGMIAAGLLPATGGRVRFEGHELDYHDGRAMQAYRRQVQLVFQDVSGALNPRMTIGSMLEETLYVHRHALNLLGRDARRARVAALLGAVGLNETHAERYPHQLSGGQRQRVGIARALSVEPQLLIADEPVSALDVSVQVQIMNLLKDICVQSGISCLLVAHDLAVVRYMCSDVYVMCKGKILEHGDISRVFDDPQHDYTQKLLSAVPSLDCIRD